MTDDRHSGERFGGPTGSDGIPCITYYNATDSLDYERRLLDEWGMADRVRLRAVRSDHPEQMDDEDFVRSVRGSQGVVVEYFTITDALMDRLPSLRVVGLQSIGTDMVDKPAATRHDIAVTNSPGFCQKEVAVTAVGMIIDVIRRITSYDRSVRRGSWDPMEGPTPRRIQGMTVGLVFFGGIPRLMAPILRAMDVRVIAYAPTKSAEYLASFGVEKAGSLDDLLRVSDVVSLHAPLMPETRHLISARELSLMKSTAFLVNTARGAIVDEKALVGALKNGTIAGAAVDVIEDEITEHTELRNLENVVINPHAAFLSEESYYQAKRMALRGMVDLLVDGRRPRYLVNSDVALDGAGPSPDGEE